MINIDSRLLQQVDANELYLLCFISNRIGSNGNAWPSNETLVKETNWHIEKLIRVKKSLEDKKLLKVKRSIGRSNRYEITTNHVGNYVNGKSVLLPESVNGKSGDAITENPISVDGKSVIDHYGKSVKEVLTSEELTTTEVLTNDEELKRKDLSFLKKFIFEELIDTFFLQLKEHKHYMLFTENAREYKTPIDETSLAFIKKISRAADKISETFSSMNRPRLKYNDGELNREGKPWDTWKEVRAQVNGYADYCRLSKTFISTDPDKLPEKLISADWPFKLFDYVKDDIKNEKYDPAYDTDLLSQWLIEMYYYQCIDAYVCCRYNDRVVVGGKEYLMTQNRTIK